MHMKILLAFLTISISISAQEIVNKTIDTQVEASNVSIELQNKIDDLDIESKKIYFEYKDTLNEYKSLKNYDDQLAKIISAQIQEIESIKNQLDSLDNINIDISITNNVAWHQLRERQWTINIFIFKFIHCQHM